jgi:transposase
MIHRFNDLVMASLDPKWVGGRPRRITTEDIDFIVKTAKERPVKAGRPFSQWSVRKLRDYLAGTKVRNVDIGRERLREILDEHEVTF